MNTEQTLKEPKGAALLDAIVRLLKAWYAHEGLIQFLLGNEWNCHDLRYDGRITLGYCWALLTVGVIIPAVVILTA